MAGPDQSEQDYLKRLPSEAKSFIAALLFFASPFLISAILFRTPVGTALPPAIAILAPVLGRAIYPILWAAMEALFYAPFFIFVRHVRMSWDNPWMFFGVFIFGIPWSLFAVVMTGGMDFAT